MCLDTSSWQISLDLCHDFWSYTFCHGNHIIPVPPPPRPYPRPLSFVLLAWIKVPMMHGATTSTVSSASTTVTNVPFAESAATNQVCSLISVLFYFSSVDSESCFHVFHQVTETPACSVTCVMSTFHLSSLCCLFWCEQMKIYFKTNLKMGNSFNP